MKSQVLTLIKRKRRAHRTHSRIRGTSACPRLSVFRGNRGMYVQIIDDEKGSTLISGSAQEVKADTKAPKKEVAYAIGELVGKKAIEKGITRVSFDRGSYRYHGRVAAVAEGARKAGLKF